MVATLQEMGGHVLRSDVLSLFFPIVAPRELLLLLVMSTKRMGASVGLGYIVEYKLYWTIYYHGIQ